MKQDSLPFFLTIAASVVAIDRLTKIMALTILAKNQSLSILPYFHLTLVTNTGISFGMFKDFPWLAFSAGILTIAAIVYWYRKIPSHWIVQTSVALIMGGAIGNLWDRVVYGTVIDFIDIVVWPVFNGADSAITIGGILIAYWVFVEEPRKGLHHTNPGKMKKAH